MADLSKSERKKLVKKAEKAAKKDASTSAAASPSQEGKISDQNNVSGSSTGTSCATIAAPKVLLFQGAQDDPATLKVVWAAIHYKISVGVAKRKDLPQGCIPGKKYNKPILIYGSGDYVLGDGGAMCKAIAFMAGESISFEADEWCEIECKTLRVNDDAAKTLKLDALAAALDASATGVHLVGESDTIADICILVTLSRYAKDHLSSWPSKYY